MPPIRLLSVFAFISFAALAEIGTECGPDRECLINVPGTQCADGTPSFITLTQRANAKKLLIYFQGGGACWSQSSCEQGLASKLTRSEDATDWATGSGIHDKSDPKNPFSADYNVITVPYCTGDVYTGARTINYGSTSNPYMIRHVGYENTLKNLQKIRELVPSPEKVVLLGCSAGGIGVYYHLRNLNETYPSIPKYVISDAGTPFAPPFVNQTNYQKIMANWGAEATLPENIRDFGSLIEQNTKNFPDIRFGFVSSYRDRTMSLFAFAIGTLTPGAAVKNTIVHLADTHLKGATNAHVFYTETNLHCQTPENLASVESMGTNLGQWMGDMVNDSVAWASERPDLDHAVLAQ